MRSTDDAIATEYTTPELVAAFIANDLEDGIGVMVGANLPIPRAGVLLAHLTHGPNMRVTLSMTRTNLFHEPAMEPFEFSTDFRAAKWAESYFIHNQLIDDIKRSSMRDVFFIGGLQIDRYGNANLIGIGADHGHLKMRGPGGVGTGDKGCHCKRYYLYINNHDRRVLVEKCDFVTAFGWGDGGAEARRKLGIPGGGPRYCITPLCIFDFHEETKHMRIKSLHPGVTLEQVLDQTGFAPIVPARIEITLPPTAAQIRILRERIDREGILRRTS
jgi:glutaconate CoA-transferase subunit B